MKYIITEPQYNFLLEQDSNYLTGNGSYYGTYGYDSKGQSGWSKLDQHTKLQVIGLGVSFIPYIGPLLSSGISIKDAQLYYKEGNRNAAAVTTLFSLLPFVGQIPGVKQLGQKGLDILSKKLLGKGSQTISKLEKEVLDGITSNQTEVRNLIKDKADELVNRGKLDLSRPTSKTKKLRTPPQTVKITDNLEMRLNPKGGIFKKIKNLSNPDEYMDLIKATDEIGDFYYLRANMKNPLDAGKSFQAMIKQIPKGARFGERKVGSLSTDSFYAMLRRIKEFQPKISGYIKLNGSGVKRFQEFIKNPKIKDSREIIFNEKIDAERLMNGINTELKKYNLPNAQVFKGPDGWGIKIPNIEFIVK